MRAKNVAAELVSIAPATVGTGDFLADGSVPMTGDLDMAGNAIANLQDPTAAQEAATKKYVDDNALGIGDFMADGSVPATGDFDLAGNDLLDVGTVNVDSVVDAATGTGPSLDFASNEIVAASKGTLQIPLAIDAVLGVSVPLQEWRVDGTPLSSIAAGGAFTGAVIGNVLGNLLLPNSSAPVDATASTKVLNSTAPNADLTLTAKTKGTLTPPVTITVEVGAALAPLSIVTTGPDIVVTLASTDGIVGTSTANAVKGIIDGDAGGAADLVTAAVEGSGLGIVDAFSIQSLAGAIDGTPGAVGQIIRAAGVPYFCTATATIATAGAWKKISLASL